MSEAISSFIRMKAQTLVDSLSELMVDASLGTIQCLEEIVSNSLLLSSTFLCIPGKQKQQQKIECSAAHLHLSLLKWYKLGIF